MSKTLDDIDTTPPEGAQEAARKALRWRDEHPDEIEGGTRTGWERANQLDNGESLSEDTITRMNSFFSRHMAQGNHELDDEYEGEPWKDAGYVAHLLWGGDTGASWAEDKVEEFENVRESTENAAVELAPDDDLTDEERDLQSIMDEEEAGLADDLRSIAIDHRRDFKERVRDGATSPEYAEEIRQELRDEYLPRYREAIRQRMRRMRQQAQDATLEHNDWAKVVREAELPVRGSVELEQFEDSMTVVISDLAREILQRNQGLMSDDLTQRLRQTPPDGEPTRRQIDRLSDESIEGIAGKAGSTAVSEGRDDVAQAATDDDGRMQEGDGDDSTDVERGRRMMAVRNAVLDANTCDPCRALDGETVQVGSARYARLTPPAECEGKHRCRCYWEYTNKSPQEIQNAHEHITMAIREGTFVEWDWSGGTAQGKVEEIERDGTLEVGDTTREGTEERAAVKIQHYEPDGDGYSPVDQRVVKYEDNLREIDPLDKPDGTARNSAVEMSDSDGYVQLFPWGKVEHQDHPDGGFTVDDEFAKNMASSFEFLATEHGWHPPILQQHRHDGHVWGRVTELEVRHGDGIYGRIEWAPAAEQKLEAGLIDSLSPTFTPEWEDPETGRQLSHVLHEVSYVSVEHLRSNETVQETLAAATDDDLFVALASSPQDQEDQMDSGTPRFIEDVRDGLERVAVENSHPEHEDSMQLFCHFLQDMIEKASTPEGLPGPDPGDHYEDLAEGADISGDDLQEMVEADRYRLPTDTVLQNVVDKFGVEEQALRTGEAFEKMKDDEPEDEPDEPEPPEEPLDERDREEQRPEEMGDDDMEMGYGDEMENSADPDELQSLRRENARLQLQTCDVDLDEGERERALKLAEQDPDAFELALDIGGSTSVESSTPHDGRPDIERGTTGTAPVGNDLEATVRRAKQDGIDPGRELAEHVQNQGFTDPDDLERLEALTDEIY